jgi:hypothetical protein
MSLIFINKLALIEDKCSDCENGSRYDSSTRQCVQHLFSVSSMKAYGGEQTEAFNDVVETIECIS